MSSFKPQISLAERPVAVDAMGGDYGHEVVVEGAVMAARELGISSILVGKKNLVNERLKELGAESEPRISVVHAPEEVTMDDTAATAIRKKPESSIRKAFEQVAEGKALGVVSAGNTGAVMAAGLFVCGTLPGIGRPAIATIVPRVGGKSPTVFLDIGANIDCHAHQLVQFALMGSHYASSVLSKPNPRIGLLSNGTEASKGNDIIRSTAMMLSEMPNVNFIGFVEGGDIWRGTSDVVVCDGFIGNVVLKTMEGTVNMVFDSIKHYLYTRLRGRIGLWLTKPILKAIFKGDLDPSTYGGAPLLGLNGIGIVCHGSSKSRAIMNGIRIAKKFAAEDLIMKLGTALSDLDSSNPGDYENGMWNRMGQKLEKKKAPKLSGIKTDKKRKSLDISN